MTEEAARLLEAAPKLPPEARAALAGSLLESLEEGVDEDTERAFRRAIIRPG